MPDMEQPEEKTYAPLEPLRRDPKYIKVIIERVLQLEGERLYQQKPRLNDEIIQIIKEEVK